MVKNKLNWLWTLLLVIPLVALSCAPEVVTPPPEEKPPVEKPPELVEYIIPCSGDWTGPYAPIIDWGVWGNTAVFDWWNETVGKDIGVKLTPKWYDTRYDTATVASLWPGILAELKPLAWLGLGGPDVAALKKRLPDDKVPMIMSTGTYGYDWIEGMNWVIQFRPTYGHEWYAVLDWILASWPEEDLPLRFATVSSDVTPAYKEVDIIYSKVYKMERYKGRAEYLGAAWVPVVPVDITDSIRPFIKKDVDWFIIQTNTSHIVACARACEALGKHCPIAVSTHSPLVFIAPTLGWDKMEGFCDSGAVASMLNYETAAYKEIWSKYRPPEADVVKDWNLTTVQFTVQPFLFCRAVERAVADVGAANLTGQAIYNAFLEMDLSEEECMGLIRSAKWGMDAPFPLIDKLGAQIGAVKDGKYTLATPNWIPIPEIPPYYE